MSDVDREPKNLPRIGAVLAGKYVVERVIGAGAMGVVVAAQHRLLRQTVALKLISGTRETHSNAVARFTREARAIAGLSSDHVVRILDFGLLDEGTPFMVMQYLPGRDLSSEVRARGGKLPLVEAVDHVIHTCAGLAVAHAAGIVHRDIKPGNLLLTARANGEPLVVIVDFGISKILTGSEEELSLTVSQTTLGSPLYMSPEQIRDPKTVDARTDIWSLGVVLRFLLTGKPAFTARDASGVLAAVIADEPAPMRADMPEIPAALEDVVLRCLEKKPAFRYKTVAELAHALAPFASPAGAALARSLGEPAGDSLAEAAKVAMLVGPPPDAGTFASMTRGAASDARFPVGRWAAIALAVAIAGALAATIGAPRWGQLRPDERAATASTSLPIPAASASGAPTETGATTLAGATEAVSASVPTASSLDGGGAPQPAPPARSLARTPGAPRGTSSTPRSRGAEIGRAALEPATPSDPLDTAK